MPRLSHQVALLIIAFAASARAQTEKLTIYADINMSDCSVTEKVNDVVDVYMFHEGGPVSRLAVEFRAPKPNCWAGAVWIGDQVPPVFLTIGSSQGNWLAIAYGKCISLPILLGTIRYFTTGAAEPCCTYPVLASTEYLTPVAADCGDPPQLVTLGSGAVTVNETADCLCDPPLSVETSTWGRVKALYR